MSHAHAISNFYLFLLKRVEQSLHVYMKVLLKWPQVDEITKFLHKVLVVGLYEKYKVPESCDLTENKPKMAHSRNLPKIAV